MDGTMASAGKHVLTDLRENISGVLPPLSPTALEVLGKRILRRDEKGTPLESPDEMFSRVAREIAEVERVYQISEPEVDRLGGSFFALMRNLDFLPNSPTLANAALPGGQLAGCFVLPIEDSMSSIFGTLRDMALIQKTGGGTGFSFSRLRPKGDFISSTKGMSSGPLSFIRLYDYACETNRLGGVRSGANMAVMRFDHPDILEFINSKTEGQGLRTFNISVGATDLFMDCVRRSADYALINPHTKKEVGRENASRVMDAIVSAAWQTGDPGLIFLDEVNRKNPTPTLGNIEATNPCGEQPLLPYESCNLGSINVANFVRDAKIDWDRLNGVIRLAVRFLDNVIDANRYPIPAIEERTKSNRKIGLGIMGFADLLIRLGVPYDTEEAIGVGEKLAEFLATSAREESRRLAESRGVFPNHSVSIFAARDDSRRNAAVSTVAPTGTISLIAGCSSGIEPLFALCYVRQMLGEKRLFSVHSDFQQMAGKYLTDVVHARISSSGTVQDILEIPSTIRRLFMTAHDIDPIWHVRMQAAFQRHVDSAVSKTVNLRHEASKEDIEKIYLLAHELRCKGITVFRDRSKSEQVLNLGVAQPSPPGTEACPECGGPMEHGSACVTCAVCGYTFCSI
jgi:ribonucleoside-diphosphate reductase alpha chain